MPTTSRSAAQPRLRAPARRRGASRAITWLASVLLLVLGPSCATVGPPGDVPYEGATPPAEHGVLAATADAFAATHEPGTSGFQLLHRNDEALLWRLALVDSATQSLDLQYFIWQDDESGRLLFYRLLEAVGRGVHVRLLVDDIGVVANDRELAALSRHPGFELRIFNPNRSRRGTIRSAIGFLASLRQLNRRMHNKLLVADGRMAIAGGRNIGNPYFGLDERYNFRDLDVLVSGAVVPDLSAAFDEFWNSDLAWPSTGLSPEATAAEIPAILEEIEEASARDRSFLEQTPYPPEHSDWSAQLAALPASLRGGTATFVQDEPVLEGDDQRRLVDLLDQFAERERGELIVVSPYVIPVEGFLEQLAELVSEGVAVHVLTGSMGSNNHTMAHSHYKKYRRPILATGATLSEFKHEPTEAIRATVDVPPVHSGFVALHTKTLVADRKRCFIGSLNLDPRAIILNTENGLLIESPALAAELAEHLEAMASPENAWAVTEDEKGRLRWTSSEGVVTRQPARSGWQRVSDFFYRLLPIESQL